MGFNDVFGDRKAKACARLPEPRPIAAEESLKDTRLIGWGNPGAIIGDGDNNIGVRPIGGQLDPTAVRGEFDRVVDEIAQGTGDLIVVGQSLQVIIYLHGQILLLAVCLEPKAPGDIGHQRLHPNRHQPHHGLAGLDLGQIQEFLRHLLERADLSVDLLK